MLCLKGGEDMARRRGQRTGYVYRRGDSWFGQFRIDTTELDENGRFKRKTLTKFVAPAAGPGKATKKQAVRQFYDDHLKELHKVGPQATLMLADFVRQRFEPDVVWSCKKGGQIHYRTILVNHVLPALGEFQLRDVTPQRVQDLMRAKLTAGKSVQTCMHIRNAISAIFRHAKRHQAFSGDLPTEGVRLPVLMPAERRAMTWTQVQALAEQLPEQVAALVRFLALTGLRIGEAMGLRWRDADLEVGVLHVRESFAHGQYQTVKTRTSRRDIPLTSLAVAQLRKLGPQAADSPVFVSRNGTPLDAHNIANRHLKDAAASAGMGTPAVKKTKTTKAKPAQSWVSWHVLRHTASTLGHDVGLSIEQRQKVLGHAAGAMTMHYTHPELDAVRERMEKIGKENVN